MRKSVLGILGVAFGIVALGLFMGCAGQETHLSMASPPPPAPEAPPPPPQQVTFPNGTVFGGASGAQASTLAQIMVDSNNNNMKEFEILQKKADKTLDASEKNLQTSQQCLALLENLQKQQGTGDMTFFFKTGRATIPDGSEDYKRLVRLLDYLSVKSQGRKILFIMIGSASATGTAEINARLSKERAEAPIPIIDKYLINSPHEFYKVYGIGDVYSPKGAPPKTDEAYQNVRVIAVYETGQVPILPQAPAR